MNLEVYSESPLSIGNAFWRHGMSTAAKTGSDPRVQSLEVSDDSITAYLVDGRTISVPLAWSWRLTNATPEQRRNYQIIGGGQGIHWPEVDEDISVRGMLDGVPAHRPSVKR